MKRIILTGATSMLGLALIDECLENDTDVVAVIRKNSSKINYLPNSRNIKVVECDITDVSSLSDSIGRGFDAFYHFAWEGTSSVERINVSTQNKNIGFTLDAVRLANVLECRKFIGAGSQAEYGRISGAINTDVTASPENAYGIAKYTAGKLSSLLAKEMDIEFIWTRIFSVYGSYDSHNSMVMYCIRSLLNNEKPRFTPCEQKWDYLYFRDAAKAFYALIEKGVNQRLYNIGSGVASPLSEYIHAIRDAINPALPLGIGDLEYSTGQVMSLHADISGLTNDTGFLPSTTFEEGIHKTVDWYKSLTSARCEDEKQ